MNISKLEQRVLHVLARGGRIRHARDERGKVTEVTCFTHDGHILSDCTPDLFARLRRRGMISSSGGQPYRISRTGIEAVRAQSDNRS
jgi:uncharacterized protein YjhX (UPF0386 family)